MPLLSSWAQGRGQGHALGREQMRLRGEARLLGRGGLALPRAEGAQAGGGAGTDRGPEGTGTWPSLGAAREKVVWHGQPGDGVGFGFH